MTPGDCFLRVIPVKDRQSFAAFAVRLMEGPHIERSMRETLVLVLWLRFDDVEEAYPSHDLTNRINVAPLKWKLRNLNCVHGY